jgi:hypothetical protein
VKGKNAKLLVLAVASAPNAKATAGFRMKSGEIRPRYATVPNHAGDMPEGTLRAILKQAGISPEEFTEMR